MTGHEIESKSQQASTGADRLLIALFLTAICLPALDTFLHLDPTPSAAELSPPSAPRLERPVTPGSLKRLLSSSKKYLAGNFGFRRVLLRLCNLSEFRLFGRYATQTVIPGKGGWLIYDPGKDGLAPRRFSAEDLERWRVALEWRRDWCRQRGLPYLLVFAPNSYTIYPEILPDSLPRVATPSLLDQLVEYLGDKSDLDILDLRRSMSEARSLGRLFHRTDTHWNELGAYVGYRAIMDRLPGHLRGPGAMPLESFDIREEEGPGGDLAGMLALRDILKEDQVLLVPRKPRSAKAPDGGPIAYETMVVKIRPFVVAENPNSTLPRAVVFRDSFASALVPLLSEHFSRIVFEWRTLEDREILFPTELIERERPAVVIEEFAERTIGSDSPKNPDH